MSARRQTHNVRAFKRLAPRTTRRVSLATATPSIQLPRVSSRAELRLSYALVAVALGYFAVMACRKIDLPGLYYDEMVYVDPAVGGAVSRRILGFPVMVMPYVGALKAYLYFPIFALFGVSAATVRLPAIFVSLLTLALTFKLARLTFRPSYSALLVLLMAADPIFIFLTKADYGPIVLMMFLKMFALYFFFLFLRTSSPRYLWGVTASCALGIYDKFNFIWFVLALIVAAAVVFRSELRSVAAQCRARFIWPALTLLLVVVGGFLASLRPFLHGQPSDLGPWRHLTYISRVYLNTMNSREEWFLAPTYSAAATITNWITLPIIGLLILTGASRVIRRRRPFAHVLSDRVIFFYLLLFVLIVAQFLVTVAAENPNHVFVVYPFHYVLLIAVADRLSVMPRADSRPSNGVSGIWVNDSRRDGWARTAVRLGSGDRVKLGGLSFSRSPVVLALLSAVALLVVSEINVGVRYQEAIDKRAFNHLWTPAIYKLAAYVDHSQADAIVSATWGIHYQVFALSQPERRQKYVDLWQEFTQLDKPQHGRQLAERFSGKRVVVLAYVAADKGAAVARQHFLSFAKYYFGGSKLERVITNDRGQAMFGVYYVDGRSRQAGAAAQRAAAFAGGPDAAIRHSKSVPK